MASLLRFERLSYAYEGRAPLFHDLDLDLGPGWTGVVGANGAGKSTLLDLVAGERSPSRGRVVLRPESARVLRVRQGLDELEAEIVALASRDDGEARRLRHELLLEPASLERWSTLSPGERRRWQLGAALAGEPDVLLLDEPDAHLDAPGKALALRALARFRGIGLLVSHRRDVLDALARRIAWLEAGHLTLHEGSYVEAKEERDRVRSALLHEREARSEAARRLERELAQRERSVHAAQAERARSKRIKGPRDSDARAMSHDYRTARAAASLGRATASLGKRTERAREAVNELVVPREAGGEITLRARRAPSEMLASIAKDELGAHVSSARLPSALALRRGTRARLAGDNGTGKTTLLRALAARLPEGLVLHLPQDLDTETRGRLAAELRSTPREDRGRWLALARRLGVDVERVLQSALPSPGEARKLLLARGLEREVAALLLDEPSNDLDLPSVERLERALAAYPGALVLVSHDDRLAAAVTEELWQLGD